MAGNGGSSSVRVAELLMAPLLARLQKTETFEDGHDFAAGNERGPVVAVESPEQRQGFGGALGG